MGKYGKAAGIIAVVVIAQIIIKVIIDTINFFPILPGLLELLGVIVVGQWSWQNLRTSENREAVLDKLQSIKKTYLGWYFFTYLESYLCNYLLPSHSFPQTYLRDSICGKNCKW